MGSFEPKLSRSTYVLPQKLLNTNSKLFVPKKVSTGPRLHNCTYVEDKLLGIKTEKKVKSNPS